MIQFLIEMTITSLIQLKQLTPTMMVLETMLTDDYPIIAHITGVTRLRTVADVQTKMEMGGPILVMTFGESQLNGRILMEMVLEITMMLLMNDYPTGRAYSLKVP